jgi:hypothetical protein
LEITLLIIAITAAWFWLDSLNARDIAVAAGRQAAEKYGLQLLDETVAISKLWLARNHYGRLKIQRSYTFEVSDTGTDRLSCSLILLGSRIESLEMPPYREQSPSLYQ